MLGLNVENISALMDRCGDFQTVGSLRSAQGVLTARLDAEVGEICEVFTSESSSFLGEAIGFQDGYTQILPYQHSDRIRAGLTVYGLGRQLKVPVGDALLGRVINGMGAPIDNAGALSCSTRVPVKPSSPPPLERPRIERPLVTGVRVVDSLLTMGVGQRVALLAGSGVGKSSLLGEIAKGADSDVNVVALIGERGREVKPFIDDCLGPEGRKKSVIVVATADQQPLMRIRAAGAALAIAHHFRESGRNVLFMLDSITRLATSQREVGLLLGEPPTMRGYTPSVFQLLSNVLEQMGTSQRGSISGIISVLVDGDDLDEPISDSVRSIVDGHIVLDRNLAQHGHYPAVNISKSISRVFRDVTEPEDRHAAAKVRDALATYAEVEDLLRVGAYVKGTSHRIDKAIHLKTAIDDFVKQGIDEHSALAETRQGMRLLADLWDV